MSIKILFQGGDNIGWSLDADRKNIKEAIFRLGLIESQSIWNADIIHNLCWYQLFEKRNLASVLKKNILVTCASFVDPEEKYNGNRWSISFAKKIARAWISPSSKQHNLLIRSGLRSFLLPFYIDLNIFNPKIRKLHSREEILHRFSIPPEIVSGKLIIGSFQRDSLGTCLDQPKWQKGPDILVELLRELPRENYILLLAGPRRHYLLRSCKRHQIPYYYIGNEMSTDDLYSNALSIEEMPWLYALCDLYLVTSRSEGGPKAILEASATNTMVISSDVGLASDFLDSRFIYLSHDEGKRLLTTLLAKGIPSQALADLVDKQCYRTRSILSYEAMDRSLQKIYYDIVDSNQ